MYIHVGFFNALYIQMRHFLFTHSVCVYIINYAVNKEKFACAISQIIVKKNQFAIKMANLCITRFA